MAIAVTINPSVIRAGHSVAAAPNYIAGDGVVLCTAAGSSGTVSWSDLGAGGTFAPATGVSVNYTPKNESKGVTIRGTDSVGNDSKALDVKATLPLQPQISYDLDLDQETKLEKARDGSEWRQERGVPMMGWSVKFLDRLIGDKNEMREFWRYHRKGRFWFYYKDVEANELVWVRFDSGVKTVPNGRNSFDMSCIVRGNYP